MHRILSINPGSTSTKIAVYEDSNEVLNVTLRHSDEEIQKYPDIFSQYDFRKDIILDALKENNIEISSLAAVVGRGGLLKPIPGGTYNVTDALIEDVKKGVSGEHASNLGAILAKEIANIAGVNAYIVDPVVVDEVEDVARISGHPKLERKSIFHALNQKAVAYRYAKEIGKNYSDLNLIVAHMGGGVSIGAHKQGRVVDVNNALNGEGPFSPERTGSLPMLAFAKLAYSGEYTFDEIKKLITGKGGFVSYLGTNDGRVVEEMMKTDETAKIVFDAFCYQVGKEIGGISTVFNGKVDAIILTGGLAYSKAIQAKITEMVSWISDVVIYPGEDEMQALTEGALRVLNGEEKAKNYEEN